MLNGVNGLLLGYTGKDPIKGGSNDTKADAFQALLAALMSQSMSMQSNNMEGLQGDFTGQIEGILSTNSREANMMGVFGMNPLTLRMMSGLFVSEQGSQFDVSGMKGFEEITKALTEETTRGNTGMVQTNELSSKFGIEAGKAAEEQNKMLFSVSGKPEEKEVDILKAQNSAETISFPNSADTSKSNVEKETQETQGTVHDYIAITREMTDSLTMLKGKVAQDAVSEQNTKTPQISEKMDVVSDFDIQDSKDASTKTEDAIFQGIQARKTEIQDNVQVIGQKLRDSVNQKQHGQFISKEDINSNGMNTADGNAKTIRQTTGLFAGLQEKMPQSVTKEQKEDTVRLYRNTVALSDFNNLANEDLSSMKESEKIDTGIEAKAVAIEKAEESRFIVTRPEFLKILKEEGAKAEPETVSANTREITAVEVENHESVEVMEQKQESPLGEDTEEKNGNSNEFEDDRSIQPIDFRNTQAAKSHETSSDVKQIASINKDEILNQILEKVKVVNGKELSELHISLKPESLGEISIKLVMDRGVMTAKILVENSQVRGLIESNLPQIRESLKTQNLDVANLNVYVNLGQGDLPNNQEFSFNRWSFNKKGSSRYSNSKEMHIEPISPREIYTQKTGLNLLA